MKKFVLLCLAAAGFTGLSATDADARELPASVPVSAAVQTLPSTAHVNATVIVETRRRPHRRFRTVRRVYYRHGVRHVSVRRVYY